MSPAGRGGGTRSKGEGKTAGTNRKEEAVRVVRRNSPLNVVLKSYCKAIKRHVSSWTSSVSGR